MQSWQISREFQFSTLDKALQALGWQRDPDALPVDPDEPTFASWSRDPDGQMEYIYNPALGVRALTARGEDVDQYLEELSRVVSLIPSPLTLAQWEQSQPPDARTRALMAAEIIKAQVMPVLAALRDDPSGDLACRLQPRPEDYALVFMGEAAIAARKAYEQAWSDPKNMWRRPGPQQREILCYVAPAGMLAYENELSRLFPGGYRAIADLLVPSRVWVSWKYVVPGTTTGLAFNGLVWIDDHWAWFPKPYRILRDIVESNDTRD